MSAGDLDVFSSLVHTHVLDTLAPELAVKGMKYLQSHRFVSILNHDISFKSEMLRPTLDGCHRMDGFVHQWYDRFCSKAHLAFSLLAVKGMKYLQSHRFDNILNHDISFKSEMLRPLDGWICGSVV